ncbi:hypothetical protein FisN_20Hh232 [Fistulifera solaris]|uniref:Oxidoreductase n=1 Tax=Fistulifera solaris TaxID=1519565 RepID=A0A1Z5JQP3_FISSO|nr:hypothetical protein FisN_20Hh232 [Fistulifera solaris]|eukprot:GAX16091.1 hypothetical protein FisN_20Hh232 [Fistulifera solaris]
MSSPNENGHEEEVQNVLDPDAVVPQLASQNINFGDMAIAVKVLNAVGDLMPKKKQKTTEYSDYLSQYQHKNLRPFRKALSACLELHKRTMFQGKTEEQHYEQRLEERKLKRQKIAETQMQKLHIAKTALRKGRLERLQELLTDQQEEEQAKLLASQNRLTFVPDGHVETACPMMLKDVAEEEFVAQLPKLRSCYVCKTRYRELHAFYDQLCPVCAALNWQKRHATADLTHRVAVLTGARVKIGLQTALKLLRANCTVVATTRFPNAAAAVYRKERDFDEWKDRLHIYGLDLRDVAGLEAFVRYLKLKFTNGIDILINNACQTVRRPAAYYTPQVQREQDLWTAGDDVHRSILAGCQEFERIRRNVMMDHKKSEKRRDGGQLPSILPASAGETESFEEMDVSTSEGETELRVSTVNQPTPFDVSGLSHSAAMSQMVILPEDAGVSDSVLPPGITDINGQQLDLRTTNSWLLKMEHVSTAELMECMFVNAIAPFVLNSRLVPLMTVHSGDGPRPDRFIINVSAMEGKFYRYKMPNHPHTNMAKAALNMMTRTSAEDLATKHGIYMNSVDTGWINDENPVEKASKIAEVNHFQTPIDEVDAAARILDPVFSGVNKQDNDVLDYGKFLKDYRETEW